MELLRVFVLALAAMVLAPAAVAATDWTKAELVTVSMVEYRFVPIIWPSGRAPPIACTSGTTAASCTSSPRRNS